MYVVTLYGCYLGQVSPAHKDFESQWDSTRSSSFLVFPSLYYHCWNSFLCWAQWHPCTSAVLRSPIWEENPFEPARGHNSLLSITHIQLLTNVGLEGVRWWFFSNTHEARRKQHLSNVQFKREVTGAYKICTCLYQYGFQMWRITKEDLIKICFIFFFSRSQHPHAWQWDGIPCRSFSRQMGVAQLPNRAVAEVWLQSWSMDKPYDETVYVMPTPTLEHLTRLP